MPKQKTHKGTKKRFRLTASGKAKHRSAGTSHLAARMSSKRKRQLRGTTVSATVESKKRFWAVVYVERAGTFVIMPHVFGSVHGGLISHASSVRVRPR